MCGSEYKNPLYPRRFTNCWLTQRSHLKTRLKKKKLKKSLCCFSKNKRCACRVLVSLSGSKPSYPPAWGRWLSLLCVSPWQQAALLVVPSQSVFISLPLQRGSPCTLQCEKPTHYFSSIHITASVGHIQGPQLCPINVQRLEVAKLGVLCLLVPVLFSTQNKCSLTEPVSPGGKCWEKECDRKER